MNVLTRNLVTGGFMVFCAAIPDGAPVKALVGIALIAWMFYLGSTKPANRV